MPAMPFVYLDYNGTTPIAPQVAAAMMPYLTNRYGNPSSSHYPGIQAREGIETARMQLASLLNCYAYEIVFTSCATESNNLAILGYLSKFRNSPGEIVSSAVEHPAVLEVCDLCRKMGFSIRLLPVDSYGRIDPDDIKKSITSRTQLITIMHANNEVGTIQPIAEIARIAASHDVVFHTDAAQSTGKISIDLQKCNIGMLTVAGHKMYAPKGVGALFIRHGITLNRILEGAGQEHHLRPGTENTLGIIGLGAAAELARVTIDQRGTHLQSMRDLLHHRLIQLRPDAKLNGHPIHRLPNTLSIAFPGIKASEILLDHPELAASAGAACHSGSSVSISHVLQAMKLDPALASGTLRFSTGIMTTENDIETAVNIMEGVLR